MCLVCCLQARDRGFLLRSKAVVPPYKTEPYCMSSFCQHFLSLSLLFAHSHKHYQPDEVLSDADLQIEPSEALAILRAAGCINLGQDALEGKSHISAQGWVVTVCNLDVGYSCDKICCAETDGTGHEKCHQISVLQSTLPFPLQAFHKFVS